MPEAILVKLVCSAFFSSSHGRSYSTRYTKYPASHGGGSHQAGGLAALAAIRVVFVQDFHLHLPYCKSELGYVNV